MNHDYAHCINYKDDCPMSCFRAQLVADLSKNYPTLAVSWMDFEESEECPKGKTEELKKVKKS